MYKRFVVSFLCIVCVVAYSIYTVDATSNDSDKNKQTEYRLGESGGYLAGNYSASKNSKEIVRFGWKNAGKGFAAEKANNLSDILHGKNAKIVGYNNLANGADRIIINRNGRNIYIQDKYYSTANKSVNAGFDSETGMFRYIDMHGNPMQLEVPKEQKDKAIELMEDKIKEGKVEGVTNPEEAKNIIREGDYTFKQAENIAKAGNIDSLKYDAKAGAITSLSSLGISFTLNFVSCMINGCDYKEALKNASVNAMKVGLGVELIYVVSSQLTKLQVQSLFKPSTDRIADLLGPNVSKALVEVLGEENQTVTSKAISSIVQSNLLVDAVTIVVLSVPDAIDLFKGRISAKQLGMNLAILVGGIATAKVGMVAGGSVGGPLGSFIGGMVGGTVGTFGADTLLTHFFKKDTEEMYDVLTSEFSKISNDYLVSKKEAELIANSLSNELSTDTLKDMYESKDREQFANKIIVKEFENQIKKREKIILPTEEQLRDQMISNMSGIVFIH